MKGTAPSVVQEHLNLIANPCHGPLVRVIDSGSITQRFRESVSMPANSASTCGYAVWFPSYHNASGATYPANLILWENTSTTQAPANTIANPFGTTINTSGLALQDPVVPSLAYNAAYSKARSLAACIQLEYTGPLQSVAGQVAILQNLPLKAFLPVIAGTGPAFSPVTVDRLFSYAAERKRLQISGHEVIWRPTSETSVMRTDGSEHVNGQIQPDGVWEQGTPAVNASLLTGTDLNECVGIGIVWKGTPASALCLNINFVKVASLELQPATFTIEQTFTSAPGEQESPGLVSKMSTWLDSSLPGWQSRAADVVGAGVGLLAKAYAPEYPMIANVASTNIFSGGARRYNIMDLD